MDDSRIAHHLGSTHSRIVHSGPTRCGPAYRGFAHRIFVFCVLACGILCSCLLPGCAAKGAVRHADAIPADSIAIAYVPADLEHFPDYWTYRNDPTVGIEISSLDLGLRLSDFAVVEVRPEAFPVLRRLGADSANGPAALRHLRYECNRLLVVIRIPVDGDGRPSGKTIASDIFHNTMEVARIFQNPKYGVDSRPITMRHTVETGHGFRAILFDKAQDRILLDTVSAVLTSGMRVRDQDKEEDPVSCHYRLFAKACLKGR
jgi:hypothetical protein